MTTLDESHLISHLTGDFRFQQKTVLAAGLNSVLEAKFLRFLLAAPRTNRQVQTHFGLGLAYHLARRGLVTNIHTNRWRLTPRGLNVLAQAAGLSPKEETTDV